MKRIVCALLILLMILSLAACANNPAPQGQAPAGQNTQQASQKLEITDLKGRKVVLDKVPERIVSLSPANTEILFAVGAGSKVVGVTSFCDYPEEVKNIQKIGTFDGPNIELIKKAQPDVVLAGGYIQEDLINTLEGLNIPVISTEAMDFNSIFDSIKLIGKITGNDDKAAEIVGGMQKKINEIAEQTKDKEKPKVFYVVWTDPLTTAGANTFINDVIKTAGGINTAEKAEGWAKYSAEQLVMDNPDILISALHSTDNGITKETLSKMPAFENLSCVKNGKIYVMPDDNIISRPGPRIVEAIEEMANVLYGAGIK